MYDSLDTTNCCSNRPSDPRTSKYARNMPNLTPQRIFRADFPLALARKLRAFFEANMGSIYTH
jgi:hypothetical protein